jgi:type 1 glutamine amidotransferase
MLLAMAAVAAFAVPVPQEPIHVLIVSGANNHDWEWTTPELGRALAETGRFLVEITYEPQRALADVAGRHARGEVDVLVLDYFGPRWGEVAERSFLAAVEQGCGVTVVHAADNAFPDWPEYERLVGLVWRNGTTAHGRYHAFDVHVVDHHHPITLGMADLRRHPDELYHKLVHGQGADYRVLLAAFSDPATGGTGRHEPMATAAHYGKGRVFHHVLGHAWKGVPESRASWADPQLRRLFARGTEWAATGAVTLSPVPLNMLSPQEQADGFELLFDGRTIARWRGYRQAAVPAQGWTVRDAAIVHEAQGGGGDLVTADEFGDFDFRFAFRVAPQANSGVIWHVLETEEQTYMTGPEYQVLDDLGHPGVDGRHGVGGLYDLVPAAAAEVRPAGAWNEGRVVVQQGRVQHWLNGVKVVDVPCRGPEWDAMIAGSKFKDWPFGRSDKGRIALQDHGDEVAYRDLRIKKL